jgi:hypothetical protein
MIFRICEFLISSVNTSLQEQILLLRVLVWQCLRSLISLVLGRWCGWSKVFRHLFTIRPFSPEPLLVSTDSFVTCNFFTATLKFVFRLRFLSIGCFTNSVLLQLALIELLLRGLCGFVRPLYHDYQLDTEMSVPSGPI